MQAYPYSHPKLESSSLNTIELETSTYIIDSHYHDVAGHIEHFKLNNPNLVKDVFNIEYIPAKIIVHRKPQMADLSNILSNCETSCEFKHVVTETDDEKAIREIWANHLEGSFIEDAKSNPSLYKAWEMWQKGAI